MGQPDLEKYRGINPVHSRPLRVADRSLTSAIPTSPCCAASPQRGGAESTENCPPEVAPGGCIWLKPHEPYSSSTSGGASEVPHTGSGGELQSTTPRSLPEFTPPLFPVQPSNRNDASSSSVCGKPDLMKELINSSPVSDLQQLSRCCSGRHNESWGLFHVIFLSLAVWLCSEK